MKICHTTAVWALVGLATLGTTSRGFGQASPYRGLWVGSVALRSVNEVAVPLDEVNNPIAPKPAVPTPTFDEANLRILLHVNGAGQVSLLKDVAILNRVASDAGDTEVFAREADLALVTDPALYSQFDPQPARRLASAAFDFGDEQATRALDALVEEAVRIATNFAMNPALNLSSQGLRVQARQNLSALIVPGVASIAENADVSESYSQFLIQVNSSTLNAIAAGGGAAVLNPLYGLATTLRDQSFYNDARGIEMLDAIVAVMPSVAPAEREAAVHNTASAYADVQNLYQRFISGKAFGDMIVAAAALSGEAAKVGGASAASIQVAMRATSQSSDAIAAAGNAKVAMYEDTRSLSALNRVLAAMAEAAFASAALPVSGIQTASETAGRTVLADMVARYPIPVQTPTRDYREFVQSNQYAGAVQKVADAAAQGAIDERAKNVLANAGTVGGAARVAAITALQTEYATASRAQRTELPLAGVFGPGSGDPRPVSELAQASDLGAAGIEGRLVLPARHPTNPFRHRRHPDHTVGFDIERVIRFDFDGGTGDELETASFGVDQVTGTYREEIFGLHKPLGPDPENNPIGLKTEGRFELNRISHIDTLNTR